MARNQDLQVESSFSLIFSMNLALSPNTFHIFACLWFLCWFFFFQVLGSSRTTTPRNAKLSADSSPSSATTLIFERATINAVICRKMWKQVEWLGLGKNIIWQFHMIEILMCEGN